MPSRQQSVFDNRVGWATTHLRKAYLLSRLRRGFVQITQRGRDVLANNPPAIDSRYRLVIPDLCSANAKGRRCQRSALPTELTPPVGLFYQYLFGTGWPFDSLVSNRGLTGHELHGAIEEVLNSLQFQIV
ncbi:MAG: winged helix-turn-helix domain-containing protein [Leptolyngbyaceae cyanobacterium]